MLSIARKWFIKDKEICYILKGSLSRRTMSADVLNLNAREICQAGVASVAPDMLIPEVLRIEGNKSFTVAQSKYEMPKSITVVGFGKAVAGMARSVEELFGERIARGILSVPSGTTEAIKASGKLHLLPQEGSKIQVYEGAKNNLPDEDSFHATKQILQMMSQLTPDDMVLVLISGGGSALLTYPKPPVTLAEKSSIIQKLSNCGASIQELNCVRKRLSAVKGGGLAKVAFPCQVISLILSDIIGDPLDMIASAPTIENTDDPKKPLEILEKYLPLHTIPEAIVNCLKDKECTKKQKTHTGFDHVHNHLIGTNRKALESAKTCAERIGYSTFFMSSSLSGDATHMGKNFAGLAHAIVGASQSKECLPLQEGFSEEFGMACELLQKLVKAAADELRSGKSCCILSGGETTVNVRGSGKGGRNQEMSLSFGIEADTIFDRKEGNEVLFLSAGSDGIDGPTDAAGAVAYLGMTVKAKMINLDPKTFLSNNDSYTFYKQFESGKNHIITGHTGTNVMDLQVLLIHPKL